MDLESWRAHLAQPLRGRKVILGVAPLAVFAEDVRRLLADGTQRPLIVADGLGAGELPSSEDADWVVVEPPPARSLGAGIRAGEAMLGDPPAEVVRAIEKYDPHGQALWVGSPFLDRGDVLGRPVVGGRRPAWAALEDKTLCDALFDAVGVRRASSEIVPVDAGRLRDASRRLDRGQGTVWSGDSTAGLNGGGDLVRWVRDERGAVEALDVLSAECERVRVVPFLDGVPCSVHGIVMPDGVVAGRPVELVMLRRAESAAFVYAGMSTWWDPPAADRDTMRDAVRRVGARLADDVGYAGAFGLDGILTADGWFPTELNARFSAGLFLISTAIPDLPLQQLQRALVSGYPPGISAPELEHLLLTGADAARRGGVRAFSSAIRPPGSQEVAVVLDAETLRPAEPEETRTATLQLGAAPIGAVLRLVLADGVLAVGDRMAPWAVATLALSDDLWGTGFGEVTFA